MVRLIQLLCEKRHCIFAISYEHPKMSDEEAMTRARTAWQTMQEQGAINPWCELCHAAGCPDSRELHFEGGETRFKTMEEAMPYLEEEQLKQLRTKSQLLAERN